MPQAPAQVTAARVVDLTFRRAPTLGSGRLVCIDGPAGSGKTTLAQSVADLDDRATVVHVDDLLEGWAGLPGVTEQLPGLLRPLAEGQPGSYRRYDWEQEAFTSTVSVEPTPLLVLEGVGAGARATTPWCTTRVWVEVPADVRLARGLARDGEAMRAHWEQWMLDEQRLFSDQETRARADMVV